MAETASSIITDALFDLGVAGQGEPIVAEDMAIAIRFLNRMMSSFDARGISLGYTVITGPTDSVTISDGAVDGVIANLAVRLAPQFDIVISQELAIAATDGYKAMLNIAVTVEPTQMPCTMPIGSGNEDFNNTVGNDKFYPCPEDTTLTEGGGNIQLESGT